jgi:transposase
MGGMFSYTQAAMERTMKVQEVILRAGISDRQMRHWRERYEEFGFRGLFDRRRRKPSPKKVSLAVVEKVLGLYREKYFDLNVRHRLAPTDPHVGMHWATSTMSWIQRPLPYPGSVLGEPSGRTRQCRNRPVPGMVS